MAFSHIIVISTLFETLDVISVWLNSAINPRVLCVSAIPIQGWHLSRETWPSEVGSLQRNRQPPATFMQNKLHVCRWNRSHERGHVRLVSAPSSNNTAESKYDIGGKQYDDHRPQLCVFYSCISSTDRPSSWCHCWATMHGKQKNLRTRNDLSMEMHSNEGKSVSTYPRRPLIHFQRIYFS